MNKKNELELVDLASYMFKYKGWDNPMESLLCFGFECNDGWFSLLKKLILKIAILDIAKEVRVVQVKEKYGTLRFYIDGGNRAIEQAIQEAENISSTTCEQCGETGTVESNHGWYSCQCPRCRDIKNESKTTYNKKEPTDS